MPAKLDHRLEVVTVRVRHECSVVAGVTVRAEFRTSAVYGPRLVVVVDVAGNRWGLLGP